MASRSLTLWTFFIFLCDCLPSVNVIIAGRILQSPLGAALVFEEERVVYTKQIYGHIIVRIMSVLDVFGI